LPGFSGGQRPGHRCPVELPLRRLCRLRRATSTSPTAITTASAGRERSDQHRRGKRLARLQRRQRAAAERSYTVGRRRRLRWQRLYCRRNRKQPHPQSHKRRPSPPWRETVRQASVATTPSYQRPVVLPYGVAVDAAGNVYIAESFNYRIRKVSGGVITTVSGRWTPGLRGGDNVPATSAQLYQPYGVAVDAAGNLLHRGTPAACASGSGERVITTVAGGAGASPRTTCPFPKAVRGGLGGQPVHRRHQTTTSSARSRTGDDYGGWKRDVWFQRR